jgi:hypothetical protein
MAGITSDVEAHVYLVLPRHWEFLILEKYVSYSRLTVAPVLMRGCDCSHNHATGQ